MNKRYAGIIENDVVNGEGICTSFFVLKKLSFFGQSW